MGNSFFMRPCYRNLEWEASGQQAHQNAEIFAFFLGVIRSIGQIVEIDDACGAHLCQWNGHLTVMQTGRGQDRTDGYITVDYVEMQL